MLTLVSNERIPLTAAMRMIFEIHSLKNATPATVSRAGILFVNEVGVMATRVVVDYPIRSRIPNRSLRWSLRLSLRWYRS